MTGPAPKPTALRVIEGNASKRALPKGEPKPTDPFCVPSWCGVLEQPYFPEVIEQIRRMQVAKGPDGLAGALLLHAIQDYIAARKTLAEEGSTFTTEKGYCCVHPAVAIRDKAWARIMAALKEFGMTPAARTRVVMTTEGAKDEFEGFLRGERRSDVPYSRREEG